MTTSFILHLPQKLLLLLFVSSSTIAFSQSDWALVYTPQEPTEHFNGIYAVTKDRVILSSEWGRVYHSSNACQTVELFQVPGNFSIFGDIGFTSPQNGFIGGGCWFPTNECTSTTMLRTTDGGETWAAQQLNGSLGVLMSVNTFPNGEVFVVGDYSGVYHFDPQTNMWDSLGTPAGIVGYHIGLDFIDPQNGFLLRHGQSNDTLYRTSNGGLSWQPVNGNAPAMSTFASEMIFLDTQRGLIAGTLGKLYHTTDGGVNWTVLKDFGENEMIHHIDFVDALTGYLALYNQQTKKGRILKTEDGALNWTPELEADDVFFHDFHFADKNNGYALDSNSKIYRRSGTSGIETVQADNPLKISPNPVSNTLNVSMKPASFPNEGLMFSLYDFSGRKVLEQNLTGENATVSCAALANGLYWYVCGSFTGKVAVQR